MLSKIESRLRMQGRGMSSSGGLEEKVCGVGTRGKEQGQEICVIRWYADEVEGVKSKDWGARTE